MRYICGYCYRAKFLCNFVAPCDDRIQEMREQAKDPEAEETEAPNSEAPAGTVEGLVSDVEVPADLSARIAR